MSCTEIDIPLDGPETDRVAKLVHELLSEPDTNTEYWLHRIFMTGVLVIEEQRIQYAAR